MRLRIKTRYLSQGNIKKICDEFMIKIFISKINENPECKDKKRKILNNGHYFIGCDKTFIFCLYEDHYFICELRLFTSDYINHIDIEQYSNNK